MRRLAGALTVFVACGTLAACGDPSAGPKVAAGQVLSVFNRLAMVDGERAAGGDAIPPGAVLSTDVGGAAKFSVGTKLDDCQIRPGSSVRLTPAPGVLLDYAGGDTLCRSAAGDLSPVELTAGRTLISLRDPVWAVGTGGGEVTLRVYRGFVELRAPTGPPRLVGPDSQSTASDGGQARAAEHVERASLDDLDRRGIDRMEAGLPLPNLQMPPPAGSPGLTGIRQRGALRVAVDSTRDERTASFVDDFSNFLAQRWDTRVELTGSRRAATDLAQGRADIAVVPTSRAAEGGLTFFDDDADRRWSLVVPNDDPAIRSALTDFLRGALEIGEYGRRYRAAFGKVPSYEAVRWLVFPDLVPPASTTTSSAAPPPTMPSGSTTSSTTTTSTTSTSTTSTTRPVPRVEVTASSATTPAASSFCPGTVRFSWIVTADGPVAMTYRIHQSDKTSTAPATYTFDKAGKTEITHAWERSVSTTGWAELEIISPRPARSRLPFTLTCMNPPF